MKRRRNRGRGVCVDSFSGVKPADVYQKWHWGVGHSETYEIDDPDLPDHLVEAGRLVELHYRPIDGSAKRKDKQLKLNRKDSNSCHLAFDPKHNCQRLYIILSASVMKRMKKDFWTHSDWEELPLRTLAKEIGGKQMTGYPKVEVRPIGILTAVVYACEKEGDGYSFYIHKMGEESGLQPALAADEKGRLWIAGGNYTSPIPGITD